MNKAGKGILWGLGLTALGVGVYFGVQYILNNRATEDWDTDTDESTGEAGADNPITDSTPKTRVVKAYTWLKKGSKDSSKEATVEYFQHILNKIIKGAKETKKYGHKMKNLSPSAKTWVERIASLGYLKADGHYGSKTETAKQTIMGSTKPRICEARKKRIDFNTTVGEKNPYASWIKNICKDQTVK